MEKSVKILLLLVFVLSVGIGSAFAQGDKAFRPPAVPLVVNDPYLSVWSFSDNLYDSWPVHWTGAVHAMSGMIRVDGRCYRFMGPESRWAQTAEQTSVVVDPTQTKCTFRADAVELKVTFTTPMLPEDIALMSCPVTFVTFDVRPLNNKPHDVSIYFDATAEWVVNRDNQPVVWERKKGNVGGMEFLAIGSEKQPILEKSGDNLRIDWGYLNIGLPKIDGNSTVIAFADDARQDFVSRGTIPKADDRDMPRPANKNWPVIACVMDLGTIRRPAGRKLVVAYDDIYSAEFMGQKLRPWYHKAYGSFEKMIAACIGKYEDILKRCDAFDKELVADAKKLGGKNYADIISLAYRQVPASGKIVVSPDGMEPWFVHKECFSNGCMATVDVSYPASPFLALFSPTLLNGMAAPILEYADSGKWPHPFAPHDIGTYPKGNGQAYNGTRLEGQMPVEECGNMIIMVAQAAKASGDTAFAKKHWKLLTQWAKYLQAKGLDPENQLCTDDFTGHLAHNTNLSLKAINALGAYGMLSEMIGKDADAKNYKRIAGDMARKWQNMADDGDHYRLTFDKADTWSMKYNLVWDKLFDLNLFDKSIAKKEVAYYLKVQNAYGLPLDNRADFTKSDWLVWCATLSESRSDFEKLIAPLYRFVDESPDRVPFSDWYFTSTGKVRGFRARTVIGGVFIRFLDDSRLWQKWSKRADKL